MKKGFTLVELLIVVVVLVILMTIAFRLGGIGDETTKRNRTINRMQRLENCLSGYYAAYGSYPPVKLHGSRDYMLKVNKYGLQCEDEAPDSVLKWENVEAACKSQPMAMCWPFSRHWAPFVNALSQMRMKTKKNPSTLDSFYALEDNSTISQWGDRSSWSDVHIFKFGVLSYLLPRYLIAMKGGGSSSGDVDKQLYSNQSQWTMNNQLPCRFESGVPYGNWDEVCEEVYQEPWRIAVLQSQAVCARWLPNLEETVAMMFEMEAYGIKLKEPNNDGDANNKFEVYDASKLGSGGSSASGSGQNYALNRVTVCDGWGNEFYYYSLPPHQSYILWSGGANGMTFPHWIVGSELEQVLQKYPDMVYGTNGEKKMPLQQVIADDIVQMSN